MPYTLFSIHGENVSGPDPLQKFDPKTGVTLASPGSVDFQVWVQTYQPLPAPTWTVEGAKVSTDHLNVLKHAFSYVQEHYPDFVFVQREWDNSASVDKEPEVVFWLNATHLY